MKVCSKCSREYDESMEVCPFCNALDEVSNNGESYQDSNAEGYNSEPQTSFCQYCGCAVEANAVFCSNCGSKLVGDVQPGNFGNQFKQAAQKVQNNEFVQSFKSDINNSKSIGMIKEKAQNTAVKAKNLSSNQVKKIIIAASVVFVLLLALIVGTNIHKCDECDKTYFGKKHVVAFWGQTENLCKDCYTDYFGDF